MNRLNFKRLILGSFVLKLISAILGIAIYAYLAIVISVSEFGLFALAMSFSLLVTGFTKQGIENLLIRFITQLDEKNRNGFYTACIIWVGLCCCILITFITAFSDSLGSLLGYPSIVLFLPWIAILVVFNSLQAVNAAMLNAIKKPRLSLLFTGIVSQTIFLMGLFLESPENALQAFTMQSYAQVLSFLASMVITLKYSRFTLANVRTLPVRELIDVNRRFFMVAVLAILTQQLPPIFIAKYASLQEVAYLAIAMKAALLFGYPLLSVNKVCAPHYSRLYYDKNIIGLKQLARTTRKKLTIIATIGLLIVVFLSEPLLSLLNPEYIKAIPFIIILTLGQWVNLATGSAVLILLMTGHERLHFWQNLIVTLFFFVSLIVFVPYYGALSAAILMALSMASKNLLGFYSVYRVVYKNKL
ncbi:lipopolysaccharide biosynthesis protein [Pseudoalteromonas gelatinilytica]